MPPKGSQTSQPSQLPEAPTFYPSTHDFKDPLAYIAKIKAEAEEFGACKIVPPPGWNPRFALNKSTLRFKTRVQSVHELQERSNAEEEFEEQYHEWLRLVKRTWKGSPMLNGREVDLFRLQKVVRRRGGHQKISDSKSWKEVCRILQIRDKSGNAAYMVRQLYQKYLLPFEEYRSKKDSQPAAGLASTSVPSTSTFDRIMAAANGKGDMEVLGAVAALMDAPAAEGHAHKRLKLEPKEEGRSKDSMRVPDNIYTMVCELCNGGHREDKIILCDKCDRGCHLFCLQPPLEQVPDGEWICPLCIAEDSESRAFRAGKELTLDQFEKLATDFKVDWFGNPTAAEKATIVDIEQAFWDVVEAGEEPTEVMYGADLDTSIMGSAFHTRARDGSLPSDETDRVYAQSPWNLNNLPSLDDSLLKHLDDSIAGVTLPWMYMGMMFSSFCWHIEDHMFYSINYHHWGDAKRWYSVPASAADAFEAAFRTALPELFEKQPDVLFHLVTMLSPRILQAAGVPVYSISQMPGEFVVTFPCSYHGGFNTGLNCAEAVNFAPSDWLRFGEASVERFRSFRKQPILSHSWLLLKVAADSPGSDLAYWAEKDLRRVIRDEKEWRFRLQKMGCFKARRVSEAVGLHAGAKDDAECAVCHCYLHLSAVECKCCPKRFVCLSHANSLCECPPGSWRLAYRHSLAELDDILAGLRARVPAEMREATPEARPPIANGSHPVIKSDRPESVTPAVGNEAAKSQSARPSTASAEPVAVEKPSASFRPTSAEPLAAPSSEPGVPCREPPGNAAMADATDPAQPEAEEPKVPLIPRKRVRKGFREPPKEVKRQRSEEPEEPPLPRLTRAAIKAEEEEKDTLEVLSALAGLSGMADFDSKARSVTPSARGSPTPQPPVHLREDTKAADQRPVSRPLSRARGRKKDMPQDSGGGLNDSFDVEAAVKDLRDLHKSWLERGYDVFRKGGARASDVEALVQQSQQLMWGYSDCQEGVPDLVTRLKEAQAWASKIGAFLKAKGSLEEVEAALTSAPIAVPGLHRLVEGVKLGRAWIANVVSMGLDQRSIDLKSLEALVAEGQRLAVALPHLKELKDRLQGARTLQDAIRTALHGAAKEETPPLPAAAGKARSRRKRHPPSSEQEAKPPTPAAPQPAAKSVQQEVTLELLRALQSQAKALKVDFKELEELQKASANVEAFQATISKTLSMKPTMEALEDLVRDYDALGVIIPDMQAISRLMNSARAWLNRARGLRQVKAPLKKMREVLHSGQRLGTSLAEVDQLRADIRRREWEENAKRVLNNKQTITAMVEAIQEAAALGMEATEVAVGIQARLDLCRNWELRAADFFTAPGRAPLSALEDLVNDGTALGIRVDRLSQAASALDAASKWSARADAVVHCEEDIPFEERPSVEDVELLLSQYQSLVVALPQAESLTIKRDEAQAWTRTAEALLSRPLSADLTTEYQEMLMEGWALGLQMEPLAGLQEFLAALEWMKRVRQSGMATHKPQPPMKQDRDQSAMEAQPQGSHSDHGAGSADAAGDRADGLANTREGPGQRDTRSAENNPGGESQDLEAALRQSTANLGPTTLQRMAPDVQATRTGSAVSDPEPSLRLSVESAQQLLVEGRTLPIDPGMLASLQHNVDLVQEWEGRLEGVGNRQRSGGIPPEDLMPLVEEARGMILQPDSLPALEEALSKAAGWQARAERLFKHGEKPLFTEVLAIAVSGREMLVQAAASEKVEAVVAAAEEWQEDCRRVLCKKGTGLRLSKCIRVIKGTLNLALQQLQLKIQEEASQPVPEDELSITEPADHEEDSKDLYCVCQQPYNTDAAMISCDSCEEWFHCRCVGVAPTTARTIKKYICPLCLAMRGHPKELEGALQRSQRTRRALPSDLAEAIRQAEGLPCKVEEAESLAGIVVMYDNWRSPVEALLQGYLQGNVRLPHEPAETQEDPHGAQAPAGKKASQSTDLSRPASSSLVLSQGQERREEQADARAGGVLSAINRPAAGAVDQSGGEANGVYRPEEEQASEPGASQRAEDFKSDTDGRLESSTEGAQPDQGEQDLDTSNPREDVGKGRVSSEPTEGQPSAQPEEGSAVRRSLSLRTLSQLLKSALSIELDVEDLPARLLEALSLHNWRARASAALKPNTRFTVEAMCKLAREGEMAAIDPAQDKWAEVLFERALKFRLWQDQLEDVVEKLAEGKLRDGEIEDAVSRGEALIKQAREFDTMTLPRGFEKDLARLEEACKLYCLCRLPYNEDRPMLSCDYCQDWFHYDCVGLRAPSDDEDDEDVAPEDYRCPNCCTKVCKAYPHQHKLPFRSLEALGLWAPKTVESVARSMASGLVQQVQPQEAQPAPRSNSSRGPIPGQAPQYNMQPRPHNAEVSQHRDGEYSAQGSHSRLHELLTPSQAQALGEAQQAMLISGMQPQQSQHSWLLNLLAAQQSIRPAMLQMGPNAFGPQGFQAGKLGHLPNGAMIPGLPNQAALLIQQLQQSQNGGPPASNAASMG